MTTNDYPVIKSTITYPDTNVVTKTFNSRGLLAEVTRGMVTLLTRNYIDAGRMSGQTFGNGRVAQTRLGASGSAGEEGFCPRG